MVVTDYMLEAVQKYYDEYVDKLECRCVEELAYGDEVCLKHRMLGAKVVRA